MLIENSLDCFIAKKQLKKNTIFTNSQVKLSEKLNVTLKTKKQIIKKNRIKEPSKKTEFFFFWKKF